jgi:hypothetical protein
MTRATLSFVAVVFGVLFSLVLYGCDGGDGGDDGATPPDVRGVYQGTATQTDSGCLDPANNGTLTSPVTVNISSQSGTDFSDTLQDASGNTANVTGQRSADGSTSGTITFAAGGAAQATFTGTLLGNVLTANYAGRVTSGETCVFQGQLTATRP